MKLVDSLAEQDALESALEQSKPTIPPPCRHLHYLLSTPFRYGAPYPRGSRFRRAGLTPGVFYASRTPHTAVAEMAFHRLLFFADSPGTPWPKNAAEYTVFATNVRTRAALDLTRSPFASMRAVWAHPTDYSGCQALADAARNTGIEVIRYESARDRGDAINLAVLSCRAFAAAEPVAWQTWRIDLSARGVRAVSAFPEARLEFGRASFASDPRIAALIWERS